MTSHGVPFGDEAHAKATHNGNLSKPFGATILDISLPIVSEDGRNALVDVGVACGGLCGAGGVRHYRRDGVGLWRLVGVGGQWIS